MPLHLLYQQLGHSNLDQTMKYARFHPEYGDVSEYFDRVGERFGLAAPDRTADAAAGQEVPA